MHCNVNFKAYFLKVTALLYYCSRCICIFRGQLDRGIYCNLLVIVTIMQDLLYVDFEAEVEDDILAIFRKGEVGSCFCLQ